MWREGVLQQKHVVFGPNGVSELSGAGLQKADYRPGVLLSIKW